MKLGTYLLQHELSDTAFAALIGRDRTSVNRWRNGKLRPDKDALSKIADATRGAVMPNDFFETPVSAPAELRSAAE